MCKKAESCVNLMKQKIRSLYKTMRAQMPKADVTYKSDAASKVFLTSEIYKASNQIMLYIPLGNETDTKNIIECSFADGKKVIFPVTDKKSGKITPHYAMADTKFKSGAFSVYEPISSDIADESDIDVVIVPGISFSKNGARIGFGKGCYDRFLKKCKGIKIGFCYNFQICDDCFEEEHDVTMDYIVTETGIIKCESGK